MPARGVPASECQRRETGWQLRERGGREPLTPLQMPAVGMLVVQLSARHPPQPGQVSFRAVLSGGRREIRGAPALVSALSGAPSRSAVPLLPGTVTRGDRGRSHLRSTADLRLGIGSGTLPFRELCWRRHAHRYQSLEHAALLMGKAAKEDAALKVVAPKN